MSYSPPTPVILDSPEYGWGGQASYFNSATREWYCCDILSERTFVELWMRSRTIEHFTLSYKHNHKNGYSPDDRSSRLRARKISERLGIDLPELPSGRRIAAERDHAEWKRAYAEEISCLVATLTPASCPACGEQNEV
jgi:hypothetical protein